MGIIISIYYLIIVYICVYLYIIYNNKLFDLMNEFSHNPQERFKISEYYNYLSNISVINLLIVICILMINLKFMSF